MTLVLPSPPDRSQKSLSSIHGLLNYTSSHSPKANGLQRFERYESLFALLCRKARANSPRYSPGLYTDAGGSGSLDGMGRGRLGAELAGCADRPWVAGARGKTFPSRLLVKRSKTFDGKVIIQSIAFDTKFRAE